MSNDAFCIVCGETTYLSSNRLCEVCFRKRVNLSKMPKVIQQFRCPKCECYEIRGRWSHMDHEPLADLRIRDNLEVDERAEDVDVNFGLQIIDDRTNRVQLDVSGTIDSFLFQDSYELLIQTSNAICTPCTRKDGAYFEAIVQLRSAGRKLSKSELKELRSTLDEMLGGMEADPMFFITKEGIVTGGWDLQLGSKSMARSWGRILTKKFGGTIKETSTVVGMRDGIEITRLTVSYRKPAYAVGDVVKLNNHLWLIDSWQKDGPIIRRINFFQRSGASWRDMEKARIICSTSEQYVVDIMNRDSSAAEVMNPHDYTMITVALPYDDVVNSTKLRIGYIDDIWVALPGFTQEVQE
jgi:nonsense-mediated mRNA decay protein 3|tara:strand:+ start:54 stop:1112 length:1059 start_codon:yes stop_codon:yes gene_type:complete